MKLNKKLELGILAVNALKNRTTPTRTADLAVEIGTTVNFLEQIMRNLRTAGIVSVKRGPGGGYFLNSERSSVTAYDVATAVGRFGPTVVEGTGATSRLRKSLIDAYLSTTI